MIGKKINQLATELAPTTTDLTIIGDPVTGVSKKITLEQLGAIFGGAVSFYTTLGDFPVTGVIDIIYCAKDTQKLYLWSGSAYVEVFPSQSLLDTYQLRSEKGVSNGYASLDSGGKVPISQLPSSIMEYKGTWNAATNTPTLANGTGDTGDVYICNVAGTVNFGAGPITFAVGDYVIYSGSIWQRSSGAVGTVTSVAVSRSGDALAITGSPITTSGTINIGFAGTGAQYIKGDGTLATFPSIISQAQNLITEVYNNTGATLTKGTIVYINGGQGNLPTVTKALATSDATSAQTYGVVQTDITNMNNGYVVVEGRLADLDTQAYANGTQLYLSPTTAGTWTSTKPYAPNHLVYVGIVVRSHPTQGVVEVKIMNGFEMDELHNVAAQSPDNNDILQYKTATSLWTKVAGTTSNIAEGSNLYYTDARSRAALSFTAGSGAYNSTTGVITIPTNTNQLTNGAAFITLASLSAGAGISYNNTTGVIASTITQYTDALARDAISLTTTGTSGAATYNNTTGVLNIPQYQTALTNPVTGTGTTNYLPKFTGTSTIGNSQVFDDGTNVGIGTNAPTSKLTVLGDAIRYAPVSLASGNAVLVIKDDGSNGTLDIASEILGDANAASNPITFRVSNVSAGRFEAMRITNSGNLGLGVTPSAWSTSFGIKVIDLGSKGSVYASDNDANLSFNQYFDGTNAVYKTTGTAGRFAIIGNEFQWRQAPSGTAGNAISFTQAMTLGANGNLTLGTTSSYSGVRFVSEFTTGVAAWFITGGDSVPVSLINNGGAISTIGFKGTSTANAFNVRVGADGENFIAYTSNTERFRIASTGAATFSSTVFVNGNTVGNGTLSITKNSTFNSEGSAGIVINSTNSLSNTELLIGTDGTNNIAYLQTAAQGTSYTSKNLSLQPNGGNVGIGTTSPSTKMHISNAGDNYYRVENTSTSNNGYFGSDSAGISLGTDSSTASLRFNTGASFTERMRINQYGQLLINATSSAYSANLYGYNLGVRGTNNQTFISIARANQTLDSQGIIIGLDTTQAMMTVHDNIPLAFSTNATERMRITSGGNVGIGTTSPSTYKLQIDGAAGIISSSNAAIEFGIRTPDATFNDSYLIFGTATNNRAQIQVTGSSANTGSMIFTTYNAGAGAERMRITSGGDVGIGTTSPATKLHIEAPAASYGLFRITSTSNNTGEASINFGRTDQAIDNRWTVGQGTDSIGDSFGFYSGGANRLVLTTSGAATFSSTIKTASPSSGSAQPWKLGSYAAGGTGTATGVIYIEVNGQIYSIPALLGTP